MSELCRLSAMSEAEQRRTLMERFGLSSGESRYLVELAQQVDAAAVDADKQALKEEFTYRSYQHDLWEVFCADLDRPFFAPLSVSGVPRIAASGFVKECYYEKGALEPLTASYAGSDSWDASEFVPLLERLEEAKLFDVIERFCASVARRARANFFKRAASLGGASDDRLVYYKDRALEAHDRAIEWLTRIGRLEAVEKLVRQREEVREGRLPEPPPISDLRRMDETVFWELISHSRSGAETVDDQLTALELLLPTFKAAEIKRFGSLYSGYMRKLYHWNVWALAYAAMGGCSDDSFMDFRTWLILQGDPALIDLAIDDPVEAARRVPRDPDVQDGTLLALIEDSYLKRRGAPMELPTMNTPKPRGREWPEDKLEERFPELVRHYRSVEACLPPIMPL